MPEWIHKVNTRRNIKRILKAMYIICHILEYDGGGKRGHAATNHSNAHHYKANGLWLSHVGKYFGFGRQSASALLYIYEPLTKSW